MMTPGVQDFDPQLLPGHEWDVGRLERDRDWDSSVTSDISYELKAQHGRGAGVWYFLNAESPKS